jgi:hypothetical protein
LPTHKLQLCKFDSLLSTVDDGMRLGVDVVWRFQVFALGAAAVACSITFSYFFRLWHLGASSLVEEFLSASSMPLAGTVNAG